GTAVGAWTAGQDPLRRHVYHASAFWAGASHRLYGQAAYVNDVSYPTVTARAWKLPQLHADLFPTPRGRVDYWEEYRGAGIEARQDLPGALESWGFTAGWAWEELARLSRVDQDLGGRRHLADAAFQGRTNPLTLSLLYDSAFPRDSRFTLGAEGGRRVAATYRLRHQATGAELDRQEVLGEWREYRGVPGLERTVVTVRAKAGAGWGDVPLQSVFQLGGLAGEFPLRGYPSRSDRGERVATATTEVRLPLWAVYRGIRDWPLFLGRVHAAAFADAGRTWEGGDGGWRRGAGAELKADTLLGYYFPTTLVLGYAHGFDRRGQDQVYVTFGAAL
ncbi:MAG: hypothetical protein ACYDA8_11845, partial [Deferrisomatales bacterium]